MSDHFLYGFAINDFPSFEGTCSATANASRRMKDNELKMCEENGVTDITEALIGFDGIAIAQDSKVASFNVTKAQLALAVAEQVPSKDGKSLIANPYKKWSDILSSLSFILLDAFAISGVFISAPEQNSFIPPPVPVDSTTGVGNFVVDPNSSATEDEKG
jgi:hypothetical protein